MARISTSEVLADDLFCDPVTVVRQREWVQEDGNAIFLEDRISILASMQAEDADDLVVEPDFRRTGGSVEVITNARLLTETKTRAADQIEWLGCRWVVKSAHWFGNFAQFSPGHCEAVAEYLCIVPPAVAPETGLTAPPTFWDDGSSQWDDGDTHFDEEAA